METQAQLQQSLYQYLLKFPNEKDRVQPFKQFVQQHHLQALYSRNNFTGHITASAFIYNAAIHSLLMIKHKTLDRWLQPGGHIETYDENIFAASLREAKEETGIDIKQLVSSAVIFDIDSHAIPANARKAEPAHTHHDIRFLFHLKDGIHQLQFIETEVAGCEWITLDALQSESGFLIITNKIKQQLA